MNRLADWLLGLRGGVLYGMVGLLVFVEDALFVGVVLPAETAAVLGGVAASRGHVTLSTMIAVVVLAAIVGDTVGYEVGRHIGARQLQHRLPRRSGRQLGRARDLLARRGGAAVFLGRYVAFFRAVMPALAGTARMPYRRFLAFNAAGGLTWGTGVVLLGYLAGNSYAAVEKTFGQAAALAVLGIVVTGVVVWRFRHFLAQRRAARNPSPGGDGQRPERKG